MSGEGFPVAARDYRQSEAYRRSDRRDPTTGQRVFPLTPMTSAQVTRKEVSS